MWEYNYVLWIVGIRNETGMASLGVAGLFQLSTWDSKEKENKRYQAGEQKIESQLDKPSNQRSALSSSNNTADSHAFARRVVSYSVLPVNHLAILSTDSLLASTETATSLQKYASIFGDEMKR